MRDGNSERFLARTEAGPPGTSGGTASAPSVYPSRKRPAHFPTVEQHGRTVIAFVTVCTDKRRPLLACDEVHSHLRTIWSNASRWLVGRYVIMPDHLHLFCAPGTWPPTELRQWVAYWKSGAARGWPGGGVTKIWQRDCWDTQLRTGDSYSEKWEYVRGNPVRHGFVQTPDNWPFQGELNALRWHD